MEWILTRISVPKIETQSANPPETKMVTGTRECGGCQVTRKMQRKQMTAPPIEKNITFTSRDKEAFVSVGLGPGRVTSLYCSRGWRSGDSGRHV